MKVQVHHELNVFACALSGVTLIEASAGTGKTWNICALYLRLLLEKEFTVDQILVVTFTSAAKTELYDRIRERLNQVAYVLKTKQFDADPFVAQLLLQLDLVSDEALVRALAKIQFAIYQFDQVAIHTIHGFCHQALLEAPFSAGLPFEFMELADDRALIAQLAQQFWRQRVEPLALQYRAFAHWLVMNGFNPEGLQAHLAQRLKRPLASVTWSIPQVPPDDGQTVQQQFTQMREARAVHLRELNALLPKTISQLNQRTHKCSSLQKIVRIWETYLENNQPFAPLPKEAFKFSQTAINGAIKKGQAPLSHAFFAQVESLQDSLSQLNEYHQSLWLQILCQWLAYAPVQLNALKHQARTLSFDDLLGRVAQALQEHPGLTKRLRQRYQAALIDEFQDTDPLQFEIFRTIFSPSGPLFLVGDPKQAIYHFRGADLHTYLQARVFAQQHYTLSFNQRSTGEMIEACNALFTQNPNAFILKGLSYLPVEVSARPRSAWVDQGSHFHAMNVWLLPEAPLLSKKEAEQAAMRACAAEIYRLLEDANAQKVSVGGQPLMPDQIAILVRTNKQGKKIKAELAAWGVASVELNQESVYLSEDARHFERLLKAIHSPNQLGLVRNALTLDWFALDAQALFELSAEHEQFESFLQQGGWVERFFRYRQIWQNRGFSLMWRTILSELSIAQNLIVLPQGERRLTNLYHLAELIQEKVSHFLGIDATLRWFAAQRHKVQSENTQLRLESDRHLVHISTIHKAKGLEYAVVFCPFLFEGENLKGTSESEVVFYHAADGRQILHYGADETTRLQASQEQQADMAAESVRLLYVALTRAVYRCYIVVGPYAHNAATQTMSKASQQALINWLVMDQPISFEQWLGTEMDAPRLLAMWRQLAPSNGFALPCDDIKRKQLNVTLVPTQAYAAAQARRTLSVDWQITSFTALIGRQKNPVLDAEFAFNDERIQEYDAPLIALLDEQDEQDEQDEHDILHFPKGAMAGECLHYLMERVDFHQPESWLDVIKQTLQAFPVAGEKPALHAMMQQLLQQMKQSRLNHHLSLLDIKNPHARFEMPFIFSFQQLELKALEALLHAFGYVHFDFQSYPLKGFMKGFIDLVFEADQRFWIVDWKSNYLGEQAQDYQQSAMEQAMQVHGYHLQALIYVLALHRYLKFALRDYDYQTHIGGYFYLFMRGMRSQWQAIYPFAGVYANCPDVKLIEALDQLFKGTDKGGR